VDGLIAARGETALYLGASDRALDSDFIARRGHARAAETFGRLPREVRDIYDGFAAAVNRYVEVHPEEFAGRRLPVFTGPDVAARDVVGPAWAVARRFSSRAETGAALMAAGEGPEEGEGLPGWEPGSNTWALAPERTTSGHAILMRNPHLSWDAGYYEAHITIPGLLNFYGDFRIGGPFGMIGGFNERLGWSSTNNAPRLNDIYALELDPDRPDHYRFDGASVPLTREPVTLRYQDDNGIGTETRDRWESPLGPVIHRDDQRVYVLRSGGDGAYRVGEQFLAHDDRRRVPGRVAGRHAYRRAPVVQLHVRRCGREHLLRLERRPSGAAPSPRRRHRGRPARGRGRRLAVTSWRSRTCPSS
jgi:acyl-homoserine-lactone acylase